MLSRMTAHRSLGLFLLFALPVLAAAPEQAVIDAEKSWGAAIVSGDMSALTKVIGDDLTYGHGNGKTDSKATYIERIRTGAQKYVSFDYDEGMRVRLFGDAAVVNESARVNSITDGVPNAPHLRILHVFVKRGGHWELVAHQSTKLPD